jgi:hypothetical protein
MSFELENIPGLSEEEQSVHAIKALAVNGRNAVNSALLRWKKDCPADFKKLMTAIRFAGNNEKDKLLNTNYVTRNKNKNHGDVYELRNNRCPLRLMFFFDADDALIICTNDFQKNDAHPSKSGGQDTAFARCAQIRDLYQQHGD